eukprot:GHVU01123033.1.p1 GENE.GHVU01123033.1~~GHVU01123033.1.p1  ORF type:complete len:765 (+),score=102.06 GHVU01123033.1:312-2606(+)
MPPRRWLTPIRPKKKKRTDWLSIVKFWFDRRILPPSELRLRLEQQHEEEQRLQLQERRPQLENQESAEEDSPGNEEAIRPFVSPRITRAEKVWQCSRCKYLLRGDSIVRLRQHLLGKFVFPADRHIKARRCRKIEKEERDELREELRPLLSPALASSTCRGEPQQTLEFETPPRYERAPRGRADAAPAGRALPPDVSRGGVGYSVAGAEPTTTAAVRQSVADLVAFAGLPFRVADSPYLHKLVDTVRRLPPDSELRLPTRDTVSGGLLDAAVAASTAEIEALQGTSLRRFGCTVTHDAWSSGKNQSFSNVAASTNGIDNFKKCWWDCRKTDDVITEQISEVVESIGAANVVHICVDGAEVSALAHLSRRYPNIEMSRCATHLEDLKMKDIAKKDFFRKPLVRAKSTSQFVLHRPLLLAELVRNTDLRPLKYGQTRFAIHLLLALRLLDLEAGFRLLVNSATWEQWVKTQKSDAKKVAARIRRRVLRDQFWDSLKLVCPVFLPLLKMLRATDCSKVGLVGQYLVRLQQQKTDVAVALSVFPDETTQEVMSVLTKRRSESHNRLYSIAFLLNPQYAGKDVGPLVGEEWVERVQSDWNDFLMTLPIPDRRQVQGEKTMFDHCQGSFAHPLAVETIGCELPHIWWERHGTGAPKLQRIACRMLSQTISASACERCWSLFSFVMSSRRLSMSPEKAQKLVACISNKLAIAAHRDAHRTDDRYPWAPAEDDEDDCAPAPLSTPDDFVIAGEDSEEQDDSDDDRSGGGLNE